MPELTRFYGIIIMMFFSDHNPPHIHARYGEKDAMFSIETGKLIQGKLPLRATTMVQDWIMINKDELLDIWKTKDFRKLDPLN